MGGNKKIAYKIVNNFIDRIDGQLKRIKEGIKMDDIKTINLEAHSIKGGAINVMAPYLMKAAEKLEIETKNGNFKNLKTLLKNIHQEYIRVKKAIAGIK